MPPRSETIMGTTLQVKRRSKTWKTLIGKI